jgi:hypothetical protein
MVSLPAWTRLSPCAPTANIRGRARSARAGRGSGARPARLRRATA